MSLEEMSMQSSSHKKVFIRTDANATMASGHVMRCLSVADALSELGVKVEFILSDGGPLKNIQDRGYAAFVLGTDWRYIEEGAEETIERCFGQSPDSVLLIDTYSVSRGYIEKLSRYGNVCYLGSKGGDLGPLSLLANYSTNINAEFYQETYEPYKTILLLGPSYAPLRSEFASLYSRPTGEIRKVLVTTGNTDPVRFMPAFLHAALEVDSLSEVEYHVVIGSMFDDADEITRIGNQSTQVVIHQAVSDMAALMHLADAAVTANGTTVYEMAAIGLPAITFAMVQEQVPSAEELSRLGATAYAGSCSVSVTCVVGEALRNLKSFVSCPSAAHALACQAHILIDGLGAGRIAEELVKL